MVDWQEWNPNWWWGIKFKESKIDYILFSSSSRIFPKSGHRLIGLLDETMQEVFEGLGIILKMERFQRTGKYLFGEWTYK